MWSRLFTLFSIALKAFSRNNCPYIAAGIAYWALFSLFPLALAGVSILGHLYAGADRQDDLVAGIVRLIPVAPDYVAGLVAEVAQARGTLGLLAILGLLWSGTAVFSAVRKGINHVWGIGQPHYFLLERAIDLVMLLGEAVLAFIGVVFTTNVLGLATFAQPPVTGSAGLLVKVVLELSALVATFGVFLVLYRYVPNTRVAWRDVWAGALVGAVLFQGVRVGFAWAIASFSSFNLVYGSLGTLMAVLVWAYLSSLALLWGAQVSATYSQLVGTRAGAEDLPVPHRETDSATRKPGPLGVLGTMASWLLPSRKGER